MNNDSNAELIKIAVIVWQFWWPFCLSDWTNSVNECKKTIFKPDLNILWKDPNCGFQKIFANIFVMFSP